MRAIRGAVRIRSLCICNVNWQLRMGRRATVELPWRNQRPAACMCRAASRGHRVRATCTPPSVRRAARATLVRAAGPRRRDRVLVRVRRGNLHVRLWSCPGSACRVRVGRTIDRRARRESRVRSRGYRVKSSDRESRTAARMAPGSWSCAEIARVGRTSRVHVRRVVHQMAVQVRRVAQILVIWSSSSSWAPVVNDQIFWMDASYGSYLELHLHSDCPQQSGVPAVNIKIKKYKITKTSKLQIRFRAKMALTLNKDEIKYEC